MQVSLPSPDSWRWKHRINSYTIEGRVPESSKKQLTLQGVRCSDDGHLCIDEGDMFVRITTLI